MKTIDAFQKTIQLKINDTYIVNSTLTILIQYYSTQYAECMLDV